MADFIEALLQIREEDRCKEAIKRPTKHKLELAAGKINLTSQNFVTFVGRFQLLICMPIFHKMKMDKFIVVAVRDLSCAFMRPPSEGFYSLLS